MSLQAWQPNFTPATENEFSLLFPSMEEAKTHILTTRNLYTDNIRQVTQVMEDTLLVTLDTGKRSVLHYLSSVAKSRPGQSWLDIDILEEAVDERLGRERKPLLYLVESYKRCMKVKSKAGKAEMLLQLQIKAVERILQRKTGKMLVLPSQKCDDLYSDYDTSVADQIMNLLKEENQAEIVEFLEASLQQLKEVHELTPKSALVHLFSRLAEDLRHISLSSVASSCDTLELIVTMCRKPLLGRAVITSSSVTEGQEGEVWQHGLLGRMLSISVINRKPEYFTVNAATMLISDYKAAETNANSNTNYHFTFLLRAWEGLLRAGARTKHQAMTWLGNCIKANEGRRGTMADLRMNTSTAMFINLSRILVTMALKLLKAPDIVRLMEIPGDYFTAVENTGQRQEEKHFCCEKFGSGSHMYGFSVGATLVPEEEEESCQSKHNLKSEMFFMAHCALDMGVNQGYRELKNLKNSLSKLSQCEKVLESGQEAIFTQMHMTPDGPVNVQILVREKSELNRIKNDLYTQHACLNTALLNSELQDQLKTFIQLTTLWLINKCGVERENFDTNLMNHLPTKAPSALSKIPEFIFENIHHFLLLHDLPPIDGRQQRQDILVCHLQADILHLLTVLMLTPWVRNPHLRAKFGKSLELLLPRQNNREEMYRAAALLQPEFQGSLLQPMAVQVSEGLFRDLPCKRELCTAIYNVFVSMEVAGEALQFDEKFSYRYPLNAVLFYLLKSEDFRKEMLAISLSTHHAMANSQQPIYLKFVNILVNDGIRLLDESLALLKKIRQIEQEMASSVWASQLDETKKQKLGDLKKCTDMSTRFNQLSSDNIRMIEALTKLSSDVFTHCDMVDMVACMLNYFLERVTGTNRKEYKIKQPESVMFYSKNLLKSLARIYSNLSTTNNFIIAIARDGRSYHPGLFHQASSALAALSASELEQEMISIAMRVSKAAVLQKKETDITLEAPDEFLDPILATLMTEPVLLPSSGKIVDRSTIAKHLLTDPSDPFNRQSLTLASVIPQEELRKRIQEWIQAQERGETVALVCNAVIETEETKDEYKEKMEVVAVSGNADQKIATVKTDVDGAIRDNAGNKPKEIKMDEPKDKTKEPSSSQVSEGCSKAFGVKVLPRIRRDLMQLNREAPEDMMVVPDENDFTRIHVIITGPEDTPYDGGFFYFTLDCPTNYPEAPPKALIQTTDGGRVRFNPNLYREGKVCLSILGTWSGPGWTSALSLHSVLLSIQSLMNEYPIRNEPGYDDLDSEDPKCKLYNEIISHEVVRVAFLGMITNPPKGMPGELHDWILQRAPRHVAAQLKAVRRPHAQRENEKFDYYENKGVFRWKTLEKELMELQLGS